MTLLCQEIGKVNKEVLQSHKWVKSFSHNAETRCVKFYHPERRDGQLLRLCRNEECTCAEGEQMIGQWSDTADTKTDHCFQKSWDTVARENTERTEICADNLSLLSI